MKDDMTETDLAAIRARCETYQAAQDAHDRAFLACPDSTSMARRNRAAELGQALGTLNAHAREDIPALLAALDARDAENARLRGALEAIANETLDMPFVYRVRAKQALAAAAHRALDAPAD